MVNEVEPSFQKTILFSIRQMSQKDNLGNPALHTIKWKDTIIERELPWKVLGMQFHQNSSWRDQITTLIIEGYNTLKTLTKIKRLTPFHVRKMPAESLIL